MHQSDVSHAGHFIERSDRIRQLLRSGTVSAAGTSDAFDHACCAYARSTILLASITRTFHITSELTYSPAKYLVRSMVMQGVGMDADTALSFDVTQASYTHLLKASISHCASLLRRY